VDSRARLIVATVLLGLAVGVQGAGDLERRAVEAVAAHRLVEARSLYRTLAAQEPATLGHQVWVARLSSWLGDYAGATAAFDRVLDRDPGHVEALVGKAYVAMWQDRFDQADALLGRAAAVSPNDAEVQLALARNYHFQGRDRDAARHVERVLAREPDRSEAQDLKRRLALAPERPGFLARLKRILTGRS
jgi:tetratricopeptide (TPR) repeat protein